MLLVASAASVFNTSLHFLHLILSNKCKGIRKFRFLKGSSLIFGASQVLRMQQVSLAARVNVSLKAVVSFPAVVHHFHSLLANRGASDNFQLQIKNGKKLFARSFGQFNLF